MKITEHDQYKALKEKYLFSWQHYTGVYAELEADGGRISEYLEQKYQREDTKAFEERKKVTDPVLHFATIIDGMNGTWASKDKDTVREWGDLGTYDEEDNLEKDSIAFRLMENADLKGTNWTPLMKKVGIMLTALHDVWGLVEGVTDEEDAHIQVINPLHVIDWFPSVGELQQVLVKEQRDNRSGIGDEGNQQETYTLFTLDGFQRFIEVDGVIEVIEEGEYSYWADASQKKKMLPIFKTSIPFPRHLGYLLALKENHIFNKKSVRDFALRNLSFAMLNVLVDDEEQWTKIKDGLIAGSNILPSYSEKGAHSFISPDGSYLSEFEKVLNQDVEDFYYNGFKKYGEAAKQVTATEVRLESHTGVEAFLSLLVGSIDEFEKQCLKRLEQVYFASPSSWGKATVQRSTDFQPEDMPNIVEMASAMVNLQRSETASRKRRVEMLNKHMTPKEIEEELQLIESENGLPINNADLG